MDRSTPGCKPHRSTADLLTWSDSPLPPQITPYSVRSHQPSDKIGKVLSGVQVTDEEAASLSNRKPCSGYKLKEMTGSGIFVAEDEDGQQEFGAANVNANNRTAVRVYQQALNGISQISFSAEESVSPKKPTSLPEVAKQRELSGTLESELESKNKKHISDVKCKELSGHDIFASHEITPRPVRSPRFSESKEIKDTWEPAPRNVRTSVKVSNPSGGQSSILFGEESVTKTAKKIHNQKFAELSGNNIFKSGAHGSPIEKALSSAKLREMSGSNIFADGEAESRDYLGGRKPPGGDSTISLI